MLICSAYWAHARTSQKPHNRLRPLKPKRRFSCGTLQWVSQPNTPKPRKANKSELILGVMGLIMGMAATAIIKKIDKKGNEMKLFI